MRKDFRRASYLLAIIVFFLGISALVISSVVNFFSYSDTVVIIGEFVSFVAFIMLMAICVFAKSDYNYVCTQFADYILDKRKKDAEYQMNEAQHLKQIQNMKSAAEHERNDAIAAALEQGRNEGAHAALQAVGSRQTAAPSERPQPSAAPQPRQTPTYMQPIMPNDEILYNEYGEPVMIRRRVRKSREHYNGDVLYDRFGNPVARRAQNIWEIGGQKIQVANQSEPPAEPPVSQQSQAVPPQTVSQPQQQVPPQTVSQPQQQVPPQAVSQPQQQVPPQTVSQPQQQAAPQPQAAQSPQQSASQPLNELSDGQQPLQFNRKTEKTEKTEPLRYF